MSTIELNVCPHEAGTIITILTERLYSMQMNSEEYTEYIALITKERDELQAELDGMNAGATLQVEHTSSNRTAAQWRDTALALSGAMNTWIADIEARLNAVDRLNSIDGETVRANLIPFINTVKAWETSIEATINISSQEDN